MRMSDWSSDVCASDLKAARPILTVTDRSKGVAGGMIEFVMQGGRVRFQIDERAARASGLRISSKLLGLAIAVEDRCDRTACPPSRDRKSVVEGMRVSERVNPGVRRHIKTKKTHKGN